jgi:uncharacterized protein (DUF342 family)
MATAKTFSGEPLPGLKLVVADDHLSAFILAEPSALTHAWPVEMLRALLSKQGIAADDAELQKLATVSGRPARQDKFEVKRGTPPTPPHPARVQLTAPLGQLVKARGVVGTIEPAAAGIPGTDVWGRPIAPATNELAAPPLPHGTVLDEDGSTIVASHPGLFVNDEHGTPGVEPATLLPSSVDSNLGRIERELSIVCGGNVRNGAHLRTGRSLTITGTLEASTAQAGLDLNVGLGIACREHGIAIAGRSVTAKHVQNSRVHAGGDVFVETEIVASQIDTLGRLVAPHATVIASTLRCARGVHVNRLGSDTAVRTVVELGHDERFAKLFAETWPAIELNRKRVKHVRTVVEPLLQNQKHLTPKQKEKATELLFDADTLQHDTDAMIEKIRTALTNAVPLLEAELIVEEVIHAGTEVRFAGIATTIRADMSGPVKLVARGVGSQRRIYAHHNGGAGHPIETRPLPENALCHAQRLLAA